MPSQNRPEAQYPGGLSKMGVETLGTTPAEAKSLIETETKRWTEVIRANRISLD